MAKPWCDDWQCPARASCARHFGRSVAYAAMRRAKTQRYPRAAGAESCAAYRRDRPRPWLMPASIRAEAGHG